MFNIIFVTVVEISLSNYRPRGGISSPLPPCPPTPRLPNSPPSDDLQWAKQIPMPQSYQGCTECCHCHFLSPVHFSWSSTCIRCEKVITHLLHFFQTPVTFVALKGHGNPKVMVMEPNTSPSPNVTWAYTTCPVFKDFTWPHLTKVLQMRPQTEVPHVYKHTKRSHTHIKDPVPHVRVWWIMETPKQPSMHWKVSDAFRLFKLDTIQKKK